MRRFLPHQDLSHGSGIRGRRFQPPQPEDRIQVKTPIAATNSAAHPAAAGPGAAFPCRADFGEALRAQFRGAGRVFVLGIGMDWKSDDRLGPALARALAQALPDDPRLRVVSGGEAPENFTGAIRPFAPSHVLLLDAVDHGLPAGTAFLVDESTITMGDMTSHRLPLKLLMHFLATTIPCRVILVGVQPRTLRAGKRISTPVRRTIAPLAKFLAQVLVSTLEETE